LGTYKHCREVKFLSEEKKRRFLEEVFGY
jgi:hypothetical protein